MGLEAKPIKTEPTENSAENLLNDSKEQLED